jgi:hypothetical protein
LEPKSSSVVDDIRAEERLRAVGLKFRPTS